MKKINNLSRSPQQGFTLIELVVVIVILGILAATAAPKFIDLTGDARSSTVQGVKAAVESANTMIHAKALVNGVADTATTLDINNTTVTTDDVAIVNTWPAATVANWEDILDLEVGTNEAFSVVAAAATTGETPTSALIVWYPTGQVTDETATTTNAIATNCFVSFTETSDRNVKPAIQAVTTGC